jgi:hypothetical protein
MLDSGCAMVEHPPISNCSVTTARRYSRTSGVNLITKPSPGFDKQTVTVMLSTVIVFGAAMSMNLGNAKTFAFVAGRV